MMPDQASPPNLDAALAHAAAGRAVFPCKPSKAPYTANGFKAATTDQEQIRWWWAQWPDALIGLPTGGRNGVFVLDVDNHGGVDGEQSLSELQDAYGALPDTIEAMTPSGGRHLFFKHPRRGAEIPNSSGTLGLGLDVRGDGGYVVAAPSVLPDGRSYEWEGSSDPDDGVRAADAPDWLLALVVKKPEPEAHEPAADGEQIHEGQRNEQLFRIGRSLRAKGLSEAAIVAALLAENAARCVPPLPEDEVTATARSAASKPPGPSEQYAMAKPNLKVVAGTEHDERPVVRIINGKLPDAVDAVERHLIELGADIYQSGTRLVRIGKWSHGNSRVERPIGSGILVDVTAEWLADMATRCIRFERFDKRRPAHDPWVRVDCPQKIATTLIARSGELKFPVLTGFCNSPTLDFDGRVISADGYDPPSGLYLCDPPAIKPIVATHRHHAERAGERIEGLIETFPFVTGADLSACMAALMTSLMRRQLPAAPLMAISATTPGTGKSKLVDVISMVASGSTAAVIGLGHTPEELEKRIHSVLLKGDVLASIDNADRAVKSDVLCQVTTQAWVTVRVLGLLKNAEALTNITMAITGNNLTLLGDLVRRAVMINLDVAAAGGATAQEIERPEKREFDFEPIERARERRAEIIHAALTITKAYLDAGCPRVEASAFGGFEVWDRLIRRPLMWAGYADPLKPAEALREQDHELAGMADLLGEWAKAFPDPVTAAELCAAVRERTYGVGDSSRPTYPSLQEAAVSVMGDLSKWGARELGYRLRAVSGRLFAARRVVRDSKTSGGVTWRVESIQ